MIDLTNLLERAAVDLAQAEARHFETSVGTTQWDVTWHRLMAAKWHYNMLEDGLSAPWIGRVWMNPPFSDPTPWVDRFFQVSATPLWVSCQIDDFIKIWHRKPGPVPR